jgi:predicted nucleotidyltransferase
MASKMTGSAALSGLYFNKTETAILEFLIRNLLKEYSITAIAKGTKKSYPIIRKNAINLEKKHIMKIKRINPTQTLCSLALENPDNVAAFSCMEFTQTSEFFSRNKGIKSIADDVLKRIEGVSFTMIIFGSCARGNAGPKSDIDMLFIVPVTEDQGSIISAVEGAGRLTNREIHPVVMAYSAFFGALREKGQNLSKEVVENHIIVYGAEAFHRGLINRGCF